MVADDGAVEVRVADDGRGGAAIRPGRGLDGLDARVQAAGGHLEVASSQAGTTVTATIPQHETNANRAERLIAR